MSTTGRKIIQSLTEFTQYQKEKPVARTKRLPCGRTVKEIDKMISHVDEFRSILLAAKDGSEIEYFDKITDAWTKNLLLELRDILTSTRIAKPTRGAK